MQITRFGQTRETGLNDAMRILERVFGAGRVNFFWDQIRRRYYVGKFLSDADEYERGPGGDVLLDHDGKPRPSLPWKRAQVLYGSGATVTEALRFLEGRRVLVGYRPSFAANGRIVKITSPAGVIVGDIPLPPEGDA